MEMKNLQLILQVMNMITSFGSICVMAYAFSKFISRPHDTLEERISIIEEKIEHMEYKLEKNTNEWKHQEDTNEVLQTCMLALIDFEIHYCSVHNETISPDLEEARTTLRKYLTRK